MLSPEWTPAARTSTFARTRTTTGREASTASLPARTTAKKRRRVLDDASTGTANTRSVYALCPSAGTWPRCGSVQPAQLTRPSAASADIPQVVRAHADVRYADDRCRRLTALAAARLPLPGPEGEVITDRLEFSSSSSGCRDLITASFRSVLSASRSPTLQSAVRGLVEHRLNIGHEIGRKRWCGPASVRPQDRRQIACHVAEATIKGRV